MGLARIFWTTVIILLLIAVGGIVAINTIGLERFREPLEAQLSDALGRKVELRGPIRLALDYRPELVLRDIRIANASWARADTLASVETLRLEAELWSLLEGQLLVDEISLAGVAVNLEEDAEETGNWEPEAAASDEPTDAGEPTGPGLSLDFRTMRIEDFALLHQDQFGTVNFDLEAGEFVKDADGRRLSGTMRGVIEGFPFDVELGIDDLRTLIETGGRSGALLGGLFGGVTFEGVGHIGVEDGDFAYAVDVVAEAGPYEGLAPDLKDTLPRGRPFEASGEVRGGFRDLMAEDLAVELMGRQARVDLHLVYPRDGRLYSGALRSRRLALDALLPAPSPTEDAPAEETSPPDPAKIGDLDFAVTLGQLDGLGLPLRDLDTELVVDNLNGRFAIHSLEVANAAWGDAASLLRLDEFSLTFPLLDILQGRVRLREVALFQTAVNLERSEDGQGNWELLSFDALGENEADSADALAGLWLERLKITDFDIGYRDPKNDLRGQIGAGSLRMAGPDAPMAGFVDGAIDLGDRWGALEFETELAVPHVAGLFAASSRPELAIDGNFGGMEAELSAALAARAGRDDEAVSSPRLRLEGNLEAQAPGALAEVFREQLPRTRPLRAEFNLEAGESDINGERVRLVLGESEVTGEVAVDMAGERPRIVADLASERLRAEDWGLLQPDTDPNDGAEEGDQTFDLGFLDTLDLDLHLRGREIAVDRFMLTDFELDAELAAGDLVVRPLHFDIGEGAVDAILEIGRNDRTYRVRQDLRITQMPIDLLFVGTEIPDYVEAPLHLRAELVGTGDDLDTLIASSNGDIRLFIGEGEIQAQLLDLAVGGVRTVLSSILTNDRDAWTGLNCAMLEGPVRNGLFTPRILYIDTASSSLAGKGEIDFAKRNLGLTLTPRSNEATLNISVPMRVQGPFDAPRVTPRPDLGTALKGLTVAASAFLFPPAAVAAFVDLGVGDRCLKAANGSARPGNGANGGSRSQ